MSWSFGIIYSTKGNDLAAYGISAPFLRDPRR